MNVRTSRRGIPLPGSEPRSRSAAIGCAAVLAAGLAAPGRAAAEPAIPPAAGPVLTVDGLPGRRLAVDAPVDAAAPLALAPRTLYLNRCSGGCVITRGNNDARNHVSSIPNPTAATPGPSFTISEYRDVSNRSGALADAEWAQLVTCMKEVYSPYNLTVTDVKPAPGTGYDEAIIAGVPGEIGQSLDVLGVAPLASDCSAINNVISFSFANAHGNLDRVNNVCWTAAQESAHAYGLDHEFSFTTGNPTNHNSACTDPMTYRNDCGGQKFFRNDFASCGEIDNRACKCSRTQNSHLKLLSVFGASVAPPIVQPPTATLGSPAQTDALLGTTVVVTAGGKRGVARVELDFNGFKWVDAPGAMFASRGQPNPSTYTIAVPSTLPSSIVDVKAIAYDDLGTPAATASVTVTRTAPCTTTTTCAGHQKCDAGRCLWDPPVGEFGVSCAYPQFCKSGICEGTADQQICTQPCIPGYVGCPEGFDCAMDGPDTGVCLFSSAGCCSVGRGGGAWWVPVGLGLAVLGLVARPRRRRR